MTRLVLAVTGAALVVIELVARGESYAVAAELTVARYSGILAMALLIATLVVGAAARHCRLAGLLAGWRRALGLASALAARWHAAGVWGSPWWPDRGASAALRSGGAFGGARPRGDLLSPMAARAPVEDASLRDLPRSAPRRPPRAAELDGLTGVGRSRAHSGSGTRALAPTSAPRELRQSPARSAGRWHRAAMRPVPRRCEISRASRRNRRAWSSRTARRGPCDPSPV